ncbi:MAG: 2-amino-4-hydroxy-6-hydroxymethyldihydropteridine diphosphokinase [Acidobacteria bacterium]|nr:MAG: 2-amino-4-hydroxy-6-hydroxymethyldihydropteridine diphosphokinase [Acidobacteriota bacterium]
MGSNLGNREAHLNHAVQELRALLSDMRVSTFISTTPVGVNEPQPDYLNAVVVGRTTLGARELLNALLAIERAHGRERRSFNAARTLDLDLILYGDAVISEPGLEVPHPRFREREFVVGPLREIAPEML